LKRLFCNISIRRQCGAFFQLQDLFGIDEQLRRQNPQEERINVPANPKNYWRYRMHLTLDKCSSLPNLPIDCVSAFKRAQITSPGAKFSKVFCRK